MTITATDGSATHGSASFTWTVTNTVAVTNPGTQSNVTGTAITALAIAATDTQSRRHPHLVGHRSARRSVHGLDRHHLGHARPRPAPAGHRQRHRRPGHSGSATFTWTITNTVTVTNPGSQSDASGHGHHRADHLGHRLAVRGHPHLVGHRPARGLSINARHRGHHRAPRRRGRLLRHHHGHRRRRATRDGQFTWTITNTVSVTNPGSQTDASRARPSPRCEQIGHGHPVRRDLHLVGHRSARGPVDQRHDRRPSRGTPTTAGTYSVTVTATDGVGLLGSATFNC